MISNKTKVKAKKVANRLVEAGDSVLTTRREVMTRTAPGRFLVAAGLLLLAACPGAKPIRALLDEPGRYDGKVVRIAGEVREAAGVLGYGAYQLDDGTGTLTVVAQGGGIPRVGARIGVEGTFRSAFTLGGRTLAVLLETRRRNP